MDSTWFILGRELKHEARESRNALCQALSLFAKLSLQETTYTQCVNTILDDKGREDPITTKSRPSSVYHQKPFYWCFPGRQMVA